VGTGVAVGTGDAEDGDGTAGAGPPEDEAPGGVSCTPPEGAAQATCAAAIAIQSLFETAVTKFCMEMPMMISPPQGPRISERRSRQPLFPRRIV
jgi:hypothetical protein